jgi:UTP--glucose-1-phosphate uridylyltransferase
VQPGDQSAYKTAAGPHARRLQFVEQATAAGYGDAIFCAREFAGRKPFVLLVSDHLYISREARSCAEQLIELARAETCSVSAVQATHESKLPYYGVVGGRLVPNRPGLYDAEEVVEKPTPTEAEQRLIVPGLRAGHYLCFFGMHVLTPAVMDFLAEALKSAADPRKVTLSSALTRLRARERYLALEVRGQRYDIGARYGLWIAQLALALDGKDKADVLAHLTELLARV